MDDWSPGNALFFIVLRVLPLGSLSDNHPTHLGSGRVPVALARYNLRSNEH